MRRSLFVIVLAALVAVAFLTVGRAAGKSYQFTGIVKSVTGDSLTVEKSAKETWQFEVGKDTKGIPKVGDKVTVNYKMVATDIEAKPAATTPPAKKK